MTYITPQRRGRRGAAAVEFALVAPFLFLILIGMVEFGRALTIHQGVTAASRAAARESVLPGATVSSVEAVAFQFVTQVPDSEVTVTTSPDPTTADAGDLITVSVSVPAQVMTKMGQIWFSTDTVLSASSTMRKEGYD